MDRTPPAAAPPGTLPRVGVVVLNYENAEDTAACIATLARLEYHPRDVIVVDNASSRGIDVLRALPEEYPGVRLILNGRNLGYAAGNNVGIRAALELGAEYVLVLNNDTLADADLLGPLVEALEADPRVAIAMPRFLNEAGADITPRRVRPTYWGYYTRFGFFAALRHRRRRARGDTALPPPPEYGAGPALPVEVPMGACMMLRRGFLREIGLLDEGTFLYQEEVILAEQARRLGRTMVVVPAARVVHLGGRSTRNFKLRRTLAMWRSQNYYLRKYRGVDPLRRWMLVGYQAATYAALSALRLLRRPFGRRA